MIRHAKKFVLLKTTKVNVNLFLLLLKHHAMEKYWRIGGIAPGIVNLCTSWRRVVTFTPGPLYPHRGKYLPIHNKYKAGWAPGPVWTRW
jgi:hypothetical protein